MFYSNKHTEVQMLSVIFEKDLGGVICINSDSISGHFLKGVTPKFQSLICELVLYFQLVSLLSLW